MLDEDGAPVGYARSKSGSRQSWWIEADSPIAGELMHMARPQTASLHQELILERGGCDLRRRQVQMALIRSTSSRKYACCDLLTVLISIALLFWAGIATLVDLQRGVPAAQALRADKRAVAFIIVESSLLFLFAMDMLLRCGASPSRFFCSCWTLYDAVVVLGFAAAFMLDRVGVLGALLNRALDADRTPGTLALLSGILLVLRNSALVVRKLISLANRFWRRKKEMKPSNRVRFGVSDGVPTGGEEEDFSSWYLPPDEDDVLGGGGSGGATADAMRALAVSDGALAS